MTRKRDWVIAQKSPGCWGKITKSKHLFVINGHLVANRKLMAPAKRLCRRRFDPVAAGSFVNKQATNATEHLALEGCWPTKIHAQPSYQGNFMPSILQIKRQSPKPGVSVILLKSCKAISHWSPLSQAPMTWDRESHCRTSAQPIGSLSLWKSL